jgi:hypothetical protein
MRDTVQCMYNTLFTYSKSLNIELGGGGGASTAYKHSNPNFNGKEVVTSSNRRDPRTSDSNCSCT